MRIEVLSLKALAARIGTKYDTLRYQMMQAKKAGMPFTVEGYNIIKQGTSNHYLVVDKEIEIDFIDE